MILPLMCIWIIVFVIIAMIDWQKHLIPNKVVYPAAVVALVVLLLDSFYAKGAWLNGYVPQPSILSGLCGAGIGLGFGLLCRLLFKAGGGDVKLFLLMGMVLGFPKAPMAFIIGGIASFIIGLVYAVLKRNLKVKLPVGTFMCVGAIIVIIFGDNIIKILAGG